MKRLGLLLLGVWVTAQCGGDDGMQPRTLTAVTILGNDSTVVLNGTRTLTAQTSPASLSGVTFTWTSSDPLSVQVTSGAASTTVTGVARDTVTIRVEASLAGQAVSATRRLRVRIGSINLTPAAPQLASLGETMVVTAEARDALDAPVPNVTFVWLSRAPSVATATESSPTQADVVAVANGTARIVATGDGVSDSVTATVRQVAATLGITPDTTTFDRLGATIMPTITGDDARGNPVAASALDWTSLNTAVATVNPATGDITSKGNGQARVIATSGSLSDTVRVGVVQQPARVKLHPQTVDTSRILTDATMRFIEIGRAHV